MYQHIYELYATCEQVYRDVAGSAIAPMEHIADWYLERWWQLYVADNYRPVEQIVEFVD